MGSSEEGAVGRSALPLDLFAELEREGARLEAEAEGLARAGGRGGAGPSSRESGSAAYRRGPDGSFSYSRSYERVTVYSSPPGPPRGGGAPGWGTGAGGAAGAGVAGLWALGAALVAAAHGRTVFLPSSRWWMALGWPYFFSQDAQFREQFRGALGELAGRWRGTRGASGGAGPTGESENKE